MEEEPLYTKEELAESIEILEASKKARKTDEKGRFLEGTAPGPGRPPDTEADKIKKKATKELIAEYKESLGEALPMIKPILIAKALDGDMTAIKEIHDRVMDKAKQPTDVTSLGEKLNVGVVILPAKNEDSMATTNETSLSSS